MRFVIVIGLYGRAFNICALGGEYGSATCSTLISALSAFNPSRLIYKMLWAGGGSVTKQQMQMPDMMARLLVGFPFGNLLFSTQSSSSASNSNTRSFKHVANAAADSSRINARQIDKYAHAVCPLSGIYLRRACFRPRFESEFRIVYSAGHRLHEYRGSRGKSRKPFERNLLC